MSMVSSHPSSESPRPTLAALAGALFSSVLWMTAAVAGSLSIELPGERAFPESITSARDGSLFVGRLGEGGIVRADPRTGAAAVFVAPGAAGSRSITGVFADDTFGTLWACSNDLSALGGSSEGRDRGAALKAFDLRTGAAKRSVPLPEPHPFCNDIAVDAVGAVYVTDSANPIVLRLPAGASGFEVFATNPQFTPPQPNSAGLDGIAFGGDGALYVTTYAAGGFWAKLCGQNRGTTSCRSRIQELATRSEGRRYFCLLLRVIDRDVTLQIVHCHSINSLSCVRPQARSTIKLHWDCPLFKGTA